MRLMFCKDGYPLYRCGHCVFVCVQLDEPYAAMTKRYYTQAYFHGSRSRCAYVDYEDEKAMMTRNVRPILATLQDRASGSRLLDVGCAYGYFMQEAERFGFRTFGVDVSAHAIAKARILFGNRVVCGTFSQIAYTPSSFDSVTMLDVFEHFDNPVKNLQKVRRILKRDGMVVIATNDTQSFWAKVMGRRWHFYVPPQHLSFFSRINLTHLLEREGFQVEKIDYTGKWIRLRYGLHLARSIQKSLFAEWLYQHVKRHPIGKLPLYVNLFDHMVVYARKNI